MFLSVLLFALSVLLTLLALLYNKYWRLYFLARQFPGPPALPLIGNALTYWNIAPEQFVTITLQFQATYGNTFRFWLGPQLNVIMQNVQDVAAVLSSPELITKSEAYRFMKVWLRDGLLLASGRKWQQRRKLITPAFHFKILEQYVEVFQRQSEIMVERCKRVGKGEKAFDLTDLLSACTLDVICETAMGVSVNAQTDVDSAYVRAVQSITRVLHLRMSDPRYYFDFIYKFTKLAKEAKNSLATLHDFTEQVIIQRRAELLRSQADQSMLPNNPCLEQLLGIKRKQAFLDILLQSQIDGKPLSNLDIREEVDTFMFEGHDTTTIAAMFLFYNLARQRECQQKCYEEISSIFNKEKKPLVVSAELLNRLNYVELCIKETLRLYPSVGMIGRRVLKEVNINGRLIPAGANIGISSFMLGRQPELYTYPLSFKPERWLRTEKLHPYAFIPFSAGPRNCIGQKFAMLELKCLTVLFLRHFEVFYAGKGEPVLVADLMVRTKEPIIFRIKDRK